MYKWSELWFLTSECYCGRAKESLAKLTVIKLKFFSYILFAFCLFLSASLLCRNEHLKFVEIQIKCYRCCQTGKIILWVYKTVCRIYIRCDVNLTSFKHLQGWWLLVFRKIKNLIQTDSQREFWWIFWQFITLYKSTVVRDIMSHKVSNFLNIFITYSAELHCVSLYIGQKSAGLFSLKRIIPMKC